MPRRAWPVRLIQLLTLPGLLVSYYLLLFHEGSLIAGCTGSGWDDCGAVSGPDAPYSSVGPVPVALIGLTGYATIFLTIWLSDSWDLVYDYLPELLMGLTSLALLFTLWLTGLELFVIHAFCRYCLVSASFALIMFVLATYNLRSSPA